MAKKISLPAIEVSPIIFSSGRLRHILRPMVSDQISKVSDIRVSRRITEQLYVLKSGEKLIITERTKMIRPEGVDGILHQTGKRMRWISHKLLEEFNGQLDAGGWADIKTNIIHSWKDSFKYKIEEHDKNGAVVAQGLRAPQIGSLHAIGAHWSLYKQPASVVLPTGTGKTETMLATLVAHKCETLLVVVPSRALKNQTVNKFLELGLLRSLGNISSLARNPIVGILDHRLTDKRDLDFLKHCNVIIATVGTVAQGAAVALAGDIAASCSHLIFDEAHHVPAETYSAFRDHFSNKPVLQFTATPFRRDGKPLEGKFIYYYPLAQAQQDGYFKQIKFVPVFEVDEQIGDEKIAEAAVAQLRADMKDGLDHLIMARCASIDRAKQILSLYVEQATDLKPVLIHSEDPNSVSLNVAKLRDRQSRIVVCVNMLGEGFDLPQLKIAAVHDTHKSIAILLQFTGRFTRSGPKNIGEATVIANIANHDVSVALERLYSEDADWNLLLREFSSQRIKDYAAMVDFMKHSKRLDPFNENSHTLPINPKSFNPGFNTVVYHCGSFSPERFVNGLPPGALLDISWLNEELDVLYFVTRSEPKVKWTHAKIRDLQRDLYVVYYNKTQELLYINCSNNDSLHVELATALGGNDVKILSGDKMFRCLAGVSRLMFQNIGLKKPGRRNLRYSMYSGADVVNALSSAEKSTSTKSNAFGSGFAFGHPVTFGCSVKGRIWSNDRGRIPELLDWCDGLGTKLLDETIDVEKIIDNVLIPRQIDAFPMTPLLSIDWPQEFFQRPEESTRLQSPFGEFSLSQYSITFAQQEWPAQELCFDVQHESHTSTFSLQLTKTPRGFEVIHKSGPQILLNMGKLSKALHEYFNDYPPHILFIDVSELDGCYLVEPKERKDIVFPPELLETWDWTGIDIRVESIWNAGAERQNSIQFRVASQVLSRFELVMDDDDKGEAADLVCMKEHDDYIELELIHCKFTDDKYPGRRVKDVVEVCSQALRSAKRIWRFDQLCIHLLSRESKSLGGRTTRLRKGSIKTVSYFRKAARYKTVKATITIVQPGLSKTNMTQDQSMVLAGAQQYLLQTVGLNLNVVCSA